MVISYEELSPKIIAELGLPLTVDTFREVFLGWTGELLPCAETLVAAAKLRNPVACLCNMNTVQWTGTFNPLPLQEADFLRLYEMAF